MKQNKEEKIKYILYARKSTESEDKQVQSIDDQLNKLKQLAKEKNLNIIEIITEEKSAKKPNNRPQFKKAMDLIESRKVNGILCWELNRLSRNPVDSGNLSWLLQEGVLKSIQTYTKEYKQEDFNALLFSIETGQANQFILDLIKDTKRGLESKANKGWFPSTAPIGYLNNKYKDKGEKDIVKDHERFNLVRKLWDLMLTGKYTVPQILKIANEDFGLRSVKRKRIGGTKFSKTGLYKVFTNVFYTGLFDWKGKRYQGNHEPMITLEDYDKVQFLLGKKGKPRAIKHIFAYSGLLKCPECSCSFTGDLKRKIAKTTGKVTEYLFYKCTNKKPEHNCINRKHIRQEKIDREIVEEIKKITFLSVLKEWSVETLNMLNETEFKDRDDIQDSLNKAISSTQKQLDNLLQLRINELISDEEYKTKKSDLQNELFRLREKLRSNEERADKYHGDIEGAFDFVEYAIYWFENADLDTKKSILLTLGSNFVISNGKLEIKHAKWVKAIHEKYKPIEEEYLRIELANSHKNLTENEKRELFAPVRSRLLPGVGSNHRPIGYYLTSIS